MRELTVEVPGGVVAVQDYGGPEGAPSALFVHGVGFSGPNWARVGEALSDRVHAYSFDLPGHAHTTVPMTGPADVWRYLPDLLHGLGLVSPVLVGHDSGSWGAMAGAIHHPDLFSAVVLVGGSVARGAEETASLLDLLSLPELREGLVTRFHLGEQGQGPESADALAMLMAQTSVKDWMLPGSAEGMLAEARHSIVVHDDGTWLHTPTLDSVVRGNSHVPGPDFPDEHLYGLMTTPTYIVQLTDGNDIGLAARERELAAANPMLRVVTLPSGQWPQYTAVDALADLIARVAA